MNLVPVLTTTWSSLEPKAQWVAWFAWRGPNPYRPMIVAVPGGAWRGYP